MSKRHVQFRCSSEPSTNLEIVIFEGREHLVVPVVALIGNSVIQASNAPTPEYIPADVIADSVSSWNGRPVLPQHPKKDGKAISANAPDIHDSLRMGIIFNAEFSDNKLKMLPYLDMERCKELGGDAKEAIEHLQDGKTIDVSVGAIVDTEDQKGASPDGKEYSAVWVELSGDHLACLPNSSGACNQDMGCMAGAPRTSERKETNMANESDPVSAPVAPVVAIDRAAEPKKDFFSRLLTKFRPAVIFDDGDSDDDLRESLSQALSDADSSYYHVCCVYPESKRVIYMTYIMTGSRYESTYKYWRRTYSLSDVGKVSVNDDAIEVQPKRVWETVEEGADSTIRESESQPKQLRAACECEDNPQPEGERAMADHVRKTTIDSLVSASKFTEKDRKSLEEMSEEGWKVVSGLAEEKKEVETPATPVPTVAAAPVSTSTSPLTEEAVLSAFPDLNKIVTQHRTNEANRKNSLVTKLAALGKISEDKLKQKSLEALEELASVSGLDEPTSPVDYSMRGFAVDPNSEDRSFEAPDGYMAALEKRKTGTQTAN